MRWWLGAVVFVSSACGSTSNVAIDATVTTLSTTAETIDVVPSAPVAAEPGQPQNFDLVTARVTKADGTTCDVCVWLANSADRRARGLMHVTDLGPAEGMAFLYPSPLTGRFWMKDTPMPLSIAFYGAAGAYLEAFDMEPCLDGGCTRYRTPDDFLIAIEVPQGQLDELGFSEATSIRLIDLPCAA